MNKLKRYTTGFIYADVDDFLPHSVSNNSLEYNINEYIKKHDSHLIILVGTFCETAINGNFFIPNAPHKIWLNTSMQTSIERALQRQLKAIGSGTNLYSFLMGKSMEESDNWLAVYLNPHLRMRENQAQKQLCSDFIEMSPDEIMNFICENEKIKQKFK